MDEEVEGEDGEIVRISKEKKQVDPVGLVMKAISHGAYWICGGCGLSLAGAREDQG